MNTFALKTRFFRIKGIIESAQRLVKLIFAEFPLHMEIIIYSLDLRECLQIGLIAFNPLKNRVSFFSIEIPTKILEKNPLIKIISQSISVFLTSIHRKKKNYLL